MAARLLLRQRSVAAGVFLVTVLCMQMISSRISTESPTGFVSVFPNGHGSARDMASRLRYKNLLRTNPVALNALCAQKGSLCKIALEGKLATETNFQKTDESTLDMMVGYREILDGLDKHVLGMNVGDTKTVRIAGAEAHGPLLSDFVVDIPADEMPEGIEEGTNVDTAQGSIAVVTGVKNNFVTTEFRHPWAGRDLDMKVTLVSSEEAPTTKNIVVTSNWPGDSKTYPANGDKITMHYQTKTPGGDVLESSRLNGAPVSIIVGEGEMDPGIDAGIMLVSHGESATIRIPSEMTYGKLADDDIIMDVELLEINGEKFDPSKRDMSKNPKPSVKKVFGNSEKMEIY